MEGASKAIRRLAQKYPDFNFVFPVHLNPIVREVVYPILQNMPNVYLIEPLDYLDFVNLMAKSYLIFTDSGGVQEEGPHFGIPILVLRSVTERPDAVNYGTVKLVGLEEENIFSTAAEFILRKDRSEFHERKHGSFLPMRIFSCRPPACATTISARFSIRRTPMAVQA